MRGGWGSLERSGPYLLISGDQGSTKHHNFCLTLVGPTVKMDYFVVKITRVSGSRS